MTLDWKAGFPLALRDLALERLAPRLLRQQSLVRVSSRRLWPFMLTPVLAVALLGWRRMPMRATSSTTVPSFRCRSRARGWMASANYAASEFRPQAGHRLRLWRSHRSVRSASGAGGCSDEQDLCQSLTAGTVQGSTLTRESAEPRLCVVAHCRSHPWLPGLLLDIRRRDGGC